MYTAQFMGNIAVPLALVLLGASFARLQTPRPLSRLPLMAMFLTTITKMAIATSSWVGEPRVKGSSQSMRLFLLTFSLIGLQFCWGTTAPRLNVQAHADDPFQEPSRHMQVLIC